jgi:hypothetical protein
MGVFPIRTGECCPMSLSKRISLSGVRLRLATIAYVDILLRSIGPVYKIRQTPISP